LCFGLVLDYKSGASALIEVQVFKLNSLEL